MREMREWGSGEVRGGEPMPNAQFPMEKGQSKI
jgi:hypothetical protein